MKRFLPHLPEKPENPPFKGKGVAMDLIQPDRLKRNALNEAINAQMNLCYTCRSCAGECPVNQFTDRLHPVKLVRMAHYGMEEELVRSPEIWYCISCNRCSHVCPMTVKPARLIQDLRWKAEEKGAVPSGTLDRVHQLQRQFNRLRWLAASRCLQGEKPGDLEARWDRLETEPVPESTLPLLRPEDRSAPKASNDFFGIPTDVTSCYTCGECRNACPVCFDSPVFDPLRLIRLSAMGFHGEALNSPSLWLCVECESCTRACGQKVKGHLAVRHLQDMAHEAGYMSQEAFRNWQKAQEELFQGLLNRVDAVLRKPH